MKQHARTQWKREEKKGLTLWLVHSIALTLNVTVCCVHIIQYVSFIVLFSCVHFCSLNVVALLKATLLEAYRHYCITIYRSLSRIFHFQAHWFNISHCQIDFNRFNQNQTIQTTSIFVRILICCCDNIIPQTNFFYFRWIGLTGTEVKSSYFLCWWIQIS